MPLSPPGSSVSPVLTISSLDKKLLMEMGGYCPVCAWGCCYLKRDSVISAVAEQPSPKSMFTWEPGGEFHLLPYQPYLILP